MKKEVQIAGTWRENSWKPKRKITKKEDAESRLKSLMKEFTQGKLKPEFGIVR